MDEGGGEGGREVGGQAGREKSHLQLLSAVQSLLLTRVLLSYIVMHGSTTWHKSRFGG